MTAPSIEPSVLVVEDEVAVAQLLEIYLSREGYDVAVVHDVAGAIADLDRHRRDLILLDIKLPDGDGLDLLGWIREHHPSSAVIAMTAFQQEEKAVRALDLGAADFVSKPFRPREVLARVNHALRAGADPEAGPI